MLGPVIPSAVRADPERDQATIRETAARELLEILPEQRGVVVLLGATVDSWQPLETWLKSREWTIFARTDSVEAADALRLRADVAGELGKRVFISQGSLQTIPLSHNLVDAILVENSAISRVSEAELLRVLRPQGQAILGQRRLVKPIPPGMDDWSHPYHGPDNNTQSDDQYVRGSLETQFVGYPKFSPMPRQTVIAGGRIYTAMGHIAHKANQNEMLNTLLCMNAYNGEILWRRELPEGFMLHRNTMIAAEDGLYLGDNAACRVFEGSTGEIRATFTIPAELTDGPVWKWTALQGNRLFALVGNPEVKIETLRSDRRGIGHWPWGMWDGHDYDDPRTAFGHGRTLVALDRTSGQLLWHHREQEFLDARAVCLRGGKLYAYAPGHSLICLEAESGRLLWRNTDRNLLEAIGPHERAQHYTTGYATSSYLKCTDDFLFFAGPQRKQMVVAATQDGSLQWTNPVGNLQLVLRADAVYAAGPQGTRGMLLDYQTGADLASLPARRACTRATGCADSIFFRAHGGTVRDDRRDSGESENGAHCSHAASLSGRRDCFKRASVLGALDVWLRIVSLRKYWVAPRCGTWCCRDGRSSCCSLSRRFSLGNLSEQYTGTPRADGSARLDDLSWRQCPFGLFSHEIARGRGTGLGLLGEWAGVSDCSHLRGFTGIPGGSSGSRARV
ncbi:MAG: PQQ-binding-like beta-propeller repeat protein [Planctomycetaceae bacterium]